MSLTVKSVVPRLQDRCMDALYNLLEKYPTSSNSRVAGPLDNLAGDLTEMLMERAYLLTPAWTTMWYLFLTPKIKRAYLPWDTKVWRIAKNKCRNLREVLVFTRNVKFKTMILDLLPGMLTTLDFHGDLFYRGRTLPRGTHNNWLTEAEAWLRYSSWVAAVKDTEEIRNQQEVREYLEELQPSSTPHHSTMLPHSPPP